ncbi:MAG: hypothetical protein MK202_11910 [Tenacibaculum sp.]|nr:hypothetical protein [Tenacibaculum sp.]
MKNLFILILFFYSSILTSQNAVFKADKQSLSRYAKNKKLYHKILQWEWVINGKHLKYGSEKVFIQPNSSKLDTILFRKNKQSTYDTIITNIAAANSYQFEFNSCCGNFNVKNKHSNKTTRANSLVQFKISGLNKDYKYLGIIGEAGIPILEANKEFNLYYKCTSAMNSNVSKVSLNIVDECDNIKDCVSLNCMFENNKVQIPTAKLEYRILTKLVEISFLPLDDIPLHINYDAIKNNIKIY